MLGKEAGLGSNAMDGDWFYLLIPMAVALAASLVLTPVVRCLAWRLRVLAHPDLERRFHPGPVPLLGGVAVYFALVAGLIAALLLDRFRQPDLARLCWMLIPAAGLACLFGVVDDCCNLRSRAKLVLQFLAALLVASAGFSVNFIIVFGCRIELGWWGVPLTICWLMGCINALNLIDGLDGLATVVGLSTTSMMGLIALNMGNDHVAAAAMALTAALAGFLVFNRPPASVFLGDSGSTLIGLVIGVLGIQGSLKSSATLSITAPVVLMTLPMFDVLMAVVRRKLTGRPLALGDREHIHHTPARAGAGAVAGAGNRRRTVSDDRRGGHGRHRFSHGCPGLDHRHDADRAHDPPAGLRTPRIRPDSASCSAARPEISSSRYFCRNRQPRTRSIRNILRGQKLPKRNRTGIELPNRRQPIIKAA